MRVGLCFDGFYSIQEMIELAELADETGMDSIWMSDHLCFRDSLTTSMALLAKTQKIKVAPAPMTPYSSRPIKMYLTAVRSRMLRLGGEIGDGVLLSAGCAPGYIARCVSEIRKGAEKAGKPSTDRDVAGFVTAAVSEDPREAIEANKMFLAYIFRNTHHAENIRLGGGKVDQEGLAVAVGERDWDAAKKYITDEVVRAQSVAGTPHE